MRNQNSNLGCFVPNLCINYHYSTSLPARYNRRLREKEDYGAKDTTTRKTLFQECVFHMAELDVLKPFFSISL